MKNIVLLTSLLILTVTESIIAQDTNINFKKNQFYLEIGGNSLVYSISYERLLSEDFTLRAGFGITPGLIFADGTFIHIPVTVSYLIGGKRSKFETGLGLTYFAGTDVEVFGLDAGDQSLIFLTGIVGYRYSSPGGFVFRIFFTPLYSSDADPYFYPYFGLSFGYAFN
jgi:hypothetical protein